MHPKLAARLKLTLQERLAQLEAERTRATESIRDVLHLLSSLESQFARCRIAALKEECREILQMIESLNADDSRGSDQVNAAVARMGALGDCLEALRREFRDPAAPAGRP